jgi:putative FmdB family regulatory protein
MPYYEYRCLDCQIGFSTFLTYEEYGKKVLLCPKCKGNNIQRKIGRVRVTRSQENRLENLADPSALEGLEDDPKAMGRMMRQMSSELGEEMGPEFNEVVSRLEGGEDPSQIEKDLPDLGGASGIGAGNSGEDDFSDF